MPNAGPRGTMAGMELRLRRELGLILGVTAWNVVQNRVYPPGVWLAQRLRLRCRPDCRTRRRARIGPLGAGTRFAPPRGLAAAPVVPATVAAVGITATTATGRRLLHDERVQRRGPAEFAKEALFRIPVGTALFEEFLFRGLLWGRWSRAAGETAATAASSALFGLWHVLPTAKTLTVYRSGRLRRSRGGVLAGVTAGVVGSAIAGVGLAVLRARARSVLAPAIVHATINVGAYIGAWVVAPPREMPPAARS